MEPLCHFWVIWAHLLAQNTQYIYYLGKFSFEPLWRRCLLTTEPPKYPLLFSEIMIRLLEHPQNHFAIFGLYELKFWLRPPSPYNMWRKKFGNLWVKLTFDDRTTQQPCTFLWNNDMVSDAPNLAFCHLWVIWAHLLAQNTQSIYYLGKFSFEALWRSCLLTTEPSTYPLLFSEIMIDLPQAIWNYFFIFQYYDPIFWLRTPCPLWGPGN